MTFTFDDTIPFATNNPSVDQPKMLANNVANLQIWDVDHVGFNATNGGTHLQNSFAQFATPVVVGGTPGSVAYPAAGTADSSRAQYFFKNSITTVPISPIRAFGAFTGGGTLLNGMNLSLNAHVPGSGVYAFDITNNAVNGLSFSIILGTGINLLNPGRGGIYQIVAAPPPSFEIAFRNFTSGALFDPDQFTVLILQV